MDYPELHLPFLPFPFTPFPFRCSSVPMPDAAPKSFSHEIDKRQKWQEGLSKASRYQPPFIKTLQPSANAGISWHVPPPLGVPRQPPRTADPFGKKRRQKSRPAVPVRRQTPLPAPGRHRSLDLSPPARKSFALPLPSAKKVPSK